MNIVRTALCMCVEGGVCGGRGVWREGCEEGGVCGGRGMWREGFVRESAA